MEFKMKAIGVIHSPYKTKEECPIQGAVKPGGRGVVELFPEYEEGLTDIELFSHILLFYVFDRAGEIKLVRRPFLDDASHGLFAIRHPCRPNGIGLTNVRLLKREGRMLHVGGIDVLDGTPLIDVKPYMPRFDHFPDADNGWASSMETTPKPKGRE